MHQHASQFRFARLVTAGLAGMAGLALTHCTSAVDNTDDLSSIKAGEISSQCALTDNVAVTSAPSPFGLQLGDQRYFLYGETWLDKADASGRGIHDNALAQVSDVGSACKGSVDYVRDKSGVPSQIIPLTNAEQEQNGTTTDRVALWPVGTFVLEDRAVVYYDKIVIHDGDYFNSTRVGTGVCVLEAAAADGGMTCKRAEPKLFADEPTLLWRWPLPSFGQGALVAQDGLAYVYSCDKYDDFDFRCRVARVDPKHASDPSAYEYRKQGESWSKVIEDASADIKGPVSLSVSWNERLAKYTGYSVRYLDREIELRTADAPEGPWSAPLTLFNAEEPTDWFVGDVRVHPELDAASAHADDVVISYHSPSKQGSGNHLVVYQLSDELKAELK